MKKMLMTVIMLVLMVSSSIANDEILSNKEFIRLWHAKEENIVGSVRGIIMGVVTSGDELLLRYIVGPSKIVEKGKTYKHPSQPELNKMSEDYNRRYCGKDIDMKDIDDLSKSCVLLYSEEVYNKMDEDIDIWHLSKLATKVYSEYCVASKKFDPFTMFMIFGTIAPEFLDYPKF